MGGVGGKISNGHFWKHRKSNLIIPSQLGIVCHNQCVKSVRIRSNSGPNAEKADQNNCEYGNFLRRELLGRKQHNPQPKS